MVFFAVAMDRVDVFDLVVDLVDVDLVVDLVGVDLDVDLLLDVGLFADLVDVDLVDRVDVALVDLVDLDRITRQECFRLLSFEKCCTTNQSICQMDLWRSSFSLVKTLKFKVSTLIVCFVDVHLK